MSILTMKGVSGQLELCQIVNLLALVALVIGSLPGSSVRAVEWTGVIDTSAGPVRGEILTTIGNSLKYSSLRSIRYAESPHGFNRFKAPIPAKLWTNIVDANVEANACPQFNLVTRTYTGQEDCLFINVFTPLIEFERTAEGLETGVKAVMVWMYGGSFISGNAKTILYGPDYLIEEDVILVTFNYRVGSFGFLNLGHPNATGNSGLMDQQLALKWVNENIEKFGGDKKKITIFGNSAGATSVDLHTLSEGSKDLFHGVISISGSLFSPWAFHTSEEALKAGYELANALGAQPKNIQDLLEVLKEATPRDIAMATVAMGEVSPPFRPSVDSGGFLTESPYVMYKRGSFTKVPYITGYTANETAYLFTQDSIKPVTDLANMAVETIDRINSSLRFSGPMLQNFLSMTKTTLQQIPNVTLAEYVAKSSFDYFQAGIDVKQRFLNDHSSQPVYYYRISFNPRESLHEMLYNVSANGAAHADELAYMFYMPIVNLPLDEAHPISKTRRRVARMWANFAKYRNPTPEGEADRLLRITWPPSGSSGIHLEIDQELSVGPRPVDASDLYNAILASTGPK